MWYQEMCGMGEIPGLVGMAEVVLGTTLLLSLQT